MDIPASVIEQYWDVWVFWRATGRRIDFDHAMTRFPTMAWSVIFLLDSLYDKMNAQKAKKEAESDGR